MYNNTLGFLKRHRRKILTSTVVLATLYGTKCLLESKNFKDLIQKYMLGNSEEGIQSISSTDDVSLSEARRHFLFDVHQQSCDKTLLHLVVQLKEKINIKFPTEELLDRLRSTIDLNTDQKIELWEQLKLRSIAKILSVITIFPLVTLVLKTQKSIICQQLFQSSSAGISNGQLRINSMLNDGIEFVKSYFYDPKDATSSQRNDQSNSTITRNLFNSSIQYFLTEGIDLLFGILKQITSDIFSSVKLTDQITAMDLHFLFERVRARTKAIGAGNNFSDFIVPTSQLNLPLNGRDGKKLQCLLRQFILILQTQQSRKLLDNFTGQYMEAFLQNIDEVIPEGKALPMAKLIPCISNAILRLTATDYNSVFYTTITSIELHQFTLFVTDCSKLEEEALMACVLATDGLLL